MKTLTINGGNRLFGEISCSGAKNSALPILAATLLTEEQCVIKNCPNLTDVQVALKILHELGCEAEFLPDGICIVSAKNITNTKISEELMREMRSSVTFLGPLLARCKQATLSVPGGCPLGPRPIDFHLNALTEMGTTIVQEDGDYHCTTTSENSCCVSLPFPSMGATENIMLRAALSNSTTTISNAALEPEIIDLANLLNSMGASVNGAGTSSIVIKGAKKLHGTEYSVMPDRIVAATYLSAVAATGGDVLVKGAVSTHIVPVLTELSRAGCDIEIDKSGNIRISRNRKLSSFGPIRTMPYPGFPTDAQALLMVPASLANGATIFVETIFEFRYSHIAELLRMGACIITEQKVAVVYGVSELRGASVNATDLRGGAALVVAALAAKGKTTISKIHHIERGYENIARDFNSLGADIQMASPFVSCVSTK